MAAGPIGPHWAAGTWSATTWSAGAWGGSTTLPAYATNYLEVPPVQRVVDVEAVGRVLEVMR